MGYIRNNDFVLREIVGESVLIPVGQASQQFNGMLTVNGIVSFIWKQLAEDTTIDQLVTAIMEEYDVQEEEARADMEQLMGEMQNIGLVICN